MGFIRTEDDKQQPQDWTTVYHLRTKDEVKAKLDEYAAKHADMGHAFILKTDNGGEYTDKDVKALLLKRQCAQEFGSPWTPEHTQIMERRWRTLVDMMHTVKQDQNEIGWDKWPLLMDHAVYLRNRIPVQALGGKSAFEARYGVKPDLRRMRIFGCTAFVNIPKGQRNKFGCKVRKGIMVGYDETPFITIYRVLVDGVVVRSSHAEFNEGESDAGLEQVEAVEDGDDDQPELVSDNELDSDDDDDDDSDDENATGSAPQASGGVPASGGISGGGMQPRRSTRRNAGKPRDYWTSNTAAMAMANEAMTNLAAMATTTDEDDNITIERSDVIMMADVDKENDSPTARNLYCKSGAKLMRNQM